MEEKKIYCIWVRTGQEDNYVKEMQPLLDSGELEITGRLYVLKKQMRLKNGKEYMDLFFPGYVFFETSETEIIKLLPLKKGKGFVKILPQTSAAQPLVQKDLNIIRSILRFGSTISIVHVDFNEDDKIVILDGPFKDFAGKIVAVNRRNKRVNVQFDFMNGLKIVGLTYEVVKKV
ncbi:KOW motif-containing protein [Treponema sp. C6A8]|uniref:KOW motif-containing protein n=1 Tax=Treponema sp. C6A8 TaxID=1410609 RepID=UPI0004817F73|nr:KOW motif-containing protein [Treponema sp. C6A8]